MFSAADKRACAERELKQRRRVYGRLLDNGKMSQALHDREIALMVEIAADYAKLAEGERLL